VGRPDRIPHNAPHVVEEDVAEVVRVLRSGWIAPGPETAALERAVAGHFGGGTAVCASSGTTALFLALVGLDVPPGAWVAVPTYSCVALLDAVRLAGARPLVVDVDADTLTMCPRSLATAAHTLGAPAAALVVHTFGHTAPLPELAEVAGQLVEDCCHSLGTRGPYGLHGTFGRAAVLSLYATKPVTGGMGGAVWSAHDDVVARIRAFVNRTGTGSRWLPIDVRLGDLPAALARSQLGRLPATIRRRAEIAARYLAVCPPELRPAGLPDPTRLVYRFSLRCPDRRYRDAALAYFRRGGVSADPLPQEELLLHHALGLNPARFPNAVRAVGRTLSLPVHPELSDAAVERVCELLAGLPAGVFSPEPR
jgi:dTDP-4-amino-4,6-dideoxygalactose transaminase